MGPLEVDGVPAHVRHLDSLSRRKVAHLRVDPAKPLVLAVLVRFAADKLHAEADAEQELALVHVAVERGNHLQAAQVLHGFLEGPDAGNDDLVVVRSEEHTSELQSLMRISYAVFCLKKK